MDHPDRTSRTQQPDPLRWYAGLPCLVAALVVAVVFIVSWPNLPDPMAVHFDEAGNVNRSSSPAELLLISEMTLLGLGLGCPGARYEDRSPYERSMPLLRLRPSPWGTCSRCWRW